MQYIIKGDPIPLARARIGYGARKMYDSQRESKVITSIHIQNQHGNEKLLIGPLHLDIIFYLKMPKKLSARKTEERNNTYHYYKPDLSNLLKFVEDVAEKVCFQNDAQIARITARKLYNEDPRTEFSLYVLDRHEKLTT